MIGFAVSPDPDPERDVSRHLEVPLEPGVNARAMEVKREGCYECMKTLEPSRGVAQDHEQCHDEQAAQAGTKSNHGSQSFAKGERA
jgi:hypothetical protein